MNVPPSAPQVFELSGTRLGGPGFGKGMPGEFRERSCSVGADVRILVAQSDDDGIYGVGRVGDAQGANGPPALLLHWILELGLKQGNDAAPPEFRDGSHGIQAFTGAGTRNVRLKK